MNRAITTTTKAQLQEYHKELLHRERQERKDKCILLTLAVAGLIGVYALVINGFEQNNLTESAPAVEVMKGNQSSPNAAVSSLQ